MLFQGQEIGSTRPWHYFIDHEPELAARVQEARAAYLSRLSALSTREVQMLLPDPAASATFDACVLDETERRLETPLALLHRDLLRLRRQDPTFTSEHPDGAVLGDRAFCVRWSERLLLVNLGTTYRQQALPEPRLAPPRGSSWRIAWSSEDARYGGRGTPEPFSRAGLTIPAHAAVLCSRAG
jgi:maltooligosyltrehalose trehalohydrolase